MVKDTEMETPASRTIGPAALIRRFIRNRKGSTAIEFAALAIPFALLVFAILESCISFAAQQVMSNAADDVARQFRTGQLKVGVTENEVRSMICDRMELIVSSGCPGLEIDLREFESFEEAAKLRIELTPDGDIDTTGFGVAPGPSMSRNVLRIFYRWPVMTDLMRRSMSNLKGGKTLHFASVTWQNEPFDD